MTAIASALQDLRTAQIALSDAQVKLWSLLVLEAPARLAFLQELGVRPDEAQRWALQARLPNGETVLELLASGREDDVKTAVQRTVYGIVG